MTCGFLVLSESAVTVTLNMRRRLVFAVFYVFVWVSVEFFNKLDPVPRLVCERNNNNMVEQHFSFYNEDPLERTETRKAGNTAKTSGIKRGL